MAQGAMLTDLILSIDAEAILLDKPAGLAVDRPRDGSSSVEDALDSFRFGFARPPSIVHRLDRDTSGVLLLARTMRSHRRFATAFEEGRVTKRYLAVLDGIPDGDEGRIAIALSKRSTREEGWRMVADPKGKASETGWRLLGVVDGRALVLFEPTSGRTHQLRVHAATGLGVPIVGDPVYGGAGGTRGGKAGEAMLLHAWTLALPREGKPPLDAVAPPPPTFDRWRDLLPARDRVPAADEKFDR